MDQKLERQKSILISCPNLSSGSIFLPYIYGLLKSAADQDPQLKESYVWLKPIYLIDTVETLLKPYMDIDINILGLSCYAWNWNLQIVIAKKIKEVNPNCLVVGGGPHLRPEDDGFFETHPYFDIVVKLEGEVIFSKILKQYLVSSNLDDYEGIEGIVFKNQKQFIPATRLKLNILPESVWRAESKVFKEIVDEIRVHQKDWRVVAICVVLETNRGCPYHCTFCDWGSLTYSRMSSFESDRVNVDIDWFAEAKIDFIFLSDSNWGMFDRDIDISKYIAKKHVETGSPKSLYYSPTKSSAKNLKPIARIFYDAKIEFSATISIQHTDPDVLKAVERKNLKDAEIEKLSIEYNRIGIPLTIQLIMGCPGDTYSKWLNCILDLIERKIEGNLIAFAFSMLPNAPASHPEYRKKWRIKTTITKTSSFSGKKNRFSPAEADHEIITSCNTFSSNDWIQMWIVYHMVNATHSTGLVKFAAEVLSCYGRLNKRIFYKNIIEGLAKTSGTLLNECAKEVENGISRFLDSPSGLYSYDEHSDVPYPDIYYFLKYDQWIFLKCVDNIDRFYQELETSLVPHLQNKMPMNEMHDLITFQKNLIVDPSYNPQFGRQFESLYDWSTLYKNRSLEVSPADLNLCLYLNKKNGPYLNRIQQTHLGVHLNIPIGWSSLTGPQRHKIWLKETVRTSFSRRSVNTFVVDKITTTRNPRRESSLRKWLRQKLNPLNPRVQSDNIERA